MNVRNCVFFCMKTKAEDKNSHEGIGINKYRLDMKLHYWKKVIQGY